MPLIHYDSREIDCKIIYYGTGLCGKTSNIRYIFNHTNPESRGTLVSIDAEQERTLFYDFLLIFLGTIKGFNLKFHLYSVPEKTFYADSKKLIMNGLDGIVFVADSQVEKMDANMESMETLKKELTSQGMDINYIPLAIQCNKRDLPNIMPVEEMKGLLNPCTVPLFESSAIKGEGVFESLRGVTVQVVEKLHNHLTAS